MRTISGSSTRWPGRSPPRKSPSWQVSSKVRTFLFNVAIYYVHSRTLETAARQGAKTVDYEALAAGSRPSLS